MPERLWTSRRQARGRDLGADDPRRAVHPCGQHGVTAAWRMLREPVARGA